MAEQDSDTSTAYIFSWDPPAEINGELQEYLLSCELEGGGPLVSATFGARNESGILELDYSIQYNCTVRARNVAALSQPSNTVSFIITETRMFSMCCMI